ncbi:hypothetical protein [Clostridium perfringens]|uniref:hypothetical protein n=1 Tax=Clostridium perfringens TaxID=1502 RepID=UPI002ACC0010|nr:hypothetical protein [Clostridium perfringens]
MKKILKNSLLSLFSLLLFLLPLKVQAMENTSFGDGSMNKSECDLKMAERRLWIDHVLWTRSFIVSDLA